MTVLAALRPGEEEPLRQVLRAIGDDIKGQRAAGPVPRPHIDFSRSLTIHFARFAILDDPERGPDRRRLLFSSNYDGDLDSHLRELIDITSDMQAIWGRCDAYAGLADFPAFIRAHSHEPAASTSRSGTRPPLGSGVRSMPGAICGIYEHLPTRGRSQPFWPSLEMIALRLAS